MANSKVYQNEEAFCWVEYVEKGKIVHTNDEAKLRVFMYCDESAPLVFQYKGKEYSFHQLGLHIPDYKLKQDDIYWKKIDKQDCHTICDMEIARLGKEGKKLNYKKRARLYAKIRAQFLGALLIMKYEQKTPIKNLVDKLTNKG